MAKSTKFQILMGFSELLKKNEFDKITVTMLVEECNISRQTFYYHFSDIEELINWGMIQATAGCLEHIKNAANIHEATVIFLTSVEENRIFLTRFLYSSLSWYITNLLRDSISEYISEFAYENLKVVKSPPEDSHFIIEFLSNAITGLVLSYIYRKKEMDIAEISEKIERIVFNRLLNN